MSNYDEKAEKVHSEIQMEEMMEEIEKVVDAKWHKRVDEAEIEDEVNDILFINDIMSGKLAVEIAKAIRSMLKGNLDEKSI